MKKLLVPLSVLVFAGCGNTETLPAVADTAINGTTVIESTDYLQRDDYSIEETTEWTIEELGATIEAAGTFWNDWWWNRRRFAFEHIVAWGGEEVPEHLDTVYLQLLPTSGFESIDDIRNHLLQYYTENWVDNELFREFAFFVEYDGILYVMAVRASFIDRIWETAEHILIEQDGNRAVVKTTVSVWCGESGEYIETQHRITFINGRINDWSMPLST